jgi:hypothetical protein
MTKLILMIAMMATIAAVSSVGARAQTVKGTGATTGTATQTPAIGQVSRPGGKPGVQIGQSGPRSSNLTPQECRMLGGKTEVDDGGTCKLRMRCTITHANGNVFSSCIDEAE